MKIKSLLFLIFILICSTGYSKEQNPVLFLEQIIKECRPHLTKENNEFLNKKITQYMDFNEMSTWIMGKKIWNDTININKKNFIKQLKILIIKTYSKTVYYYVDTDIKFFVPKNQINNLENKKIQLSSIIIKNNKKININYKLIKHEESWLIFDVIIEGISILKSLKTQYSEMIRLKGIEYTIKKIKEKI